MFIHRAMWSATNGVIACLEMTLLMVLDAWGRTGKKALFLLIVCVSDVQRDDVIFATGRRVCQVVVLLV